MNIIVTGSNSGFGRLTVETLARAGHTVFAGVRESTGRNAAGAAELRDLGASLGGRIHVLDLDVLVDASVEAAVAQVAAATGGAIDVAVNNAGRFALGILECYTVAQLRDLLDLNVLGPARINRAVLPHMRARRSGLLIQLSSIAGRLALPLMGVYSASKYATEAMAESLRAELEPLGVDSVLVEPGAFPTNVGNNAMYPADTARADGYGALAAKPQAVGEALGQLFSSPQSPRPQAVADAILKLVQTPFGQRPVRTVVDDLTGDLVRAVNEADARNNGQMRAAFGL